MSEWQPISTAPKDGTGILAWIPDWTTTMVVFWKESRWWMPVGYDGLMSMRGDPPITHWMPLPEPPK